MRRKYNRDMALDAIRRLKQAIPDVTLSADVIVGFPGETEEDFADTMAFFEETRFLHMHIFPYSRRAGTVADRMEHQVPEPVKSERSDALEAVEKSLREAYIAQFDGTEEEVLLEEETEAEGCSYMVGHTTRYVKVFVPKTCGVPGANETVTIRLTEKRCGDGVMAMWEK